MEDCCFQSAACASIEACEYTINLDNMVESLSQGVERIIATVVVEIEKFRNFFGWGWTINFATVCPEHMSTMKDTYMSNCTS